MAEKRSESPALSPESPALTDKHGSNSKKVTKSDSDKPKRPPSAFFLYLEDFRMEFLEKNPEAKSMHDVGKACGEKWKTMTYEEKVRYYDIATKKRTEFDRAMADYNKRKEDGAESKTTTSIEGRRRRTVPSRASWKRKTTSKKVTKSDSNMPKKPPTAFFFYLEDFRKEFQAKNPEVKSMRDVGKACGEKWKTMTYEEKVRYYDIATRKRTEFDIAMADYNKRKENGEFEKDEDDSAFDD
ncbi:unnamed protein product [Cuscuta campestris]|uniref:HMG box domain-containing protein n=2 Tax=Cuscuta sect. Cleistogrammica TaxID=1824901 RepID=A0A484NPC5_9ASTE|nr:hypothetical protein DM860_007961 [Cuscuta australis]VFR03051.1 unnamed protein product [Cuscuta campestris]